MPPRLITCRVMLDEFREVLPPDTPIDVLDIGLHCRPSKLYAALRRAGHTRNGWRTRSGSSTGRHRAPRP